MIADRGGLLRMVEFRIQWATSSQWTIRSVRMPLPKSQNQRQLRKLVIVEVLLRGVAEKVLPVELAWIDVLRAAANAVGVAVPGHVHLVDVADPAGLRSDLVRLGDVRHAPLLRADLHDLAMLGQRRR